MTLKLGVLPLMFQPGERWQYGVSIDVLGELVSRISGLILHQFFEERIFQPLGMNDTSFHVPEGKQSRLPVNYRWLSDDHREITDHPSNSHFLKQPTFFSGGGGLISSTMDYMSFCQMILNGGELDGARILGTKSVELMSMDHLHDATVPKSGVTLGEECGLGLGYRVLLNPSRAHRLGSPGTLSWGGHGVHHVFH